MFNPRERVVTNLSLPESGIKKAMNEESMAQFHCTMFQFSFAVYVALELLTPWSSLSQKTSNLNNLQKFLWQATAT
jgi:hypothetical protein